MITREPKVNLVNKMPPVPARIDDNEIWRIIGINYIDLIIRSQPDEMDQ